MNNIAINYAESIFEPFYDGGESYPNHEKYSVLKNYKLSYGDGVISNISQTWFSVCVNIQEQTNDEYLTVMEREISLDIGNYDIFRIFAAVPKAFSFRVFCEIDGISRLVIEASGNDSTGEYNGKIEGGRVTRIRLEFRASQNGLLANLHWMGLSNSAKEAEMVSRKNSFGEDWEGCFKDDFEIKPEISMYFSEGDLPSLRKKISKQPFKAIMDDIRKVASEDMLLNPEDDIGEYIGVHDRRFVRDRDMKKESYLGAMGRLSFVGIIDENTDMLKMSCRMALSIAHSKTWTEGVIGNLPGATWHHRSFTEETALTACASVLDLAGSLLTWHGKNIIYDAMIMKGLPRVEADFKTVDYIREMNQGIVFSTGRINGLIALTKRYPRYEAWLLEAEKDLFSMIDNYIQLDGGVLEGPGYWNYTFHNILPVFYALAKFHNLPLSEYMHENIKLTSKFGLALMSDIGDGTRHLPINDAHTLSYHPIIPAVFCQICDEDIWGKIYANTLAYLPKQPFNSPPFTEFKYAKEFLILAPEPNEPPSEIVRTGFSHFQDSGQTSLRQMSEIGTIHLHLISGPAFFSHCHGDKGSFILEVDKKPIFIDRGVCQYGNSYVFVIGKAYNHNILSPENRGGFEINQPPRNSFGGQVLKAEFENGRLHYITDLKNAWEEGVFKKYLRHITSQSPLSYTIVDEYEFFEDREACFRLHTYGDMKKNDDSFEILFEGVKATVKPVDYMPSEVEFGVSGCDEHEESVNSLRLYIKKSTKNKITTAITISK